MMLVDATRDQASEPEALAECSEAGSSAAPSVPARMAVALIRMYRRYISRLFPPVCRFRPTCSEYALQAIEKYGLLGGGWRALKRLVRCHPGHPGGYDPVQ
jgi:putative membrane protein insertion efficiency factor